MTQDPRDIHEYFVFTRSIKHFSCIPDWPVILVGLE